MSDVRLAPATAEMPEIRWTFRRWFTYVASAVLAALLAFIIWRTADPKTLRDLGLALCALIALLQLLYLGGATLTDLWQLVSAVRTTRIITTGEEKKP